MYILPFLPTVFDEQVANASVQVSEGESVTLTCNVMETNLFLSEQHTLLWIKLDVDKRSSCASSTQLQQPGIHNLTISSATPADSGQYLCAVHTDTIRVWRIICNTTVTIEESLTGELRDFNLKFEHQRIWLRCYMTPQKKINWISTLWINSWFKVFKGFIFTIQENKCMCPICISVPVLTWQVSLRIQVLKHHKVSLWYNTTLNCWMVQPTQFRL